MLSQFSRQGKVEEKMGDKWPVRKRETEDGFKDAFCQNGISLIVNADGALFIKKNIFDKYSD